MGEPKKKSSILDVTEMRDEHETEANDESNEAAELEGNATEILPRTGRAKEFNLIGKLAESGGNAKALIAEIFKLLDTPHSEDELKEIIREHEEEAADIRSRLPWSNNFGTDNKYKDDLRLLQPLSTYIDDPTELQEESRNKGKKGEAKMIHNAGARKITDGSGKVVALDNALQEHLNVIAPDKKNRLVYRWAKYEPTMAIPYLSKEANNRIEVGDLVTARQVTSTSSHNFMIHNSEDRRKSKITPNSNCSFLKMAIITSSGAPVGNAMVMQKNGKEQMQYHGTLHYEYTKMELEKMLEKRRVDFETTGNPSAQKAIKSIESVKEKLELIRPQAEVLVKRWVVFEVIDIRPVDVPLENGEHITDVHVILQEKELTNEEEVKEIKDVFTGNTIMTTSNGDEDIIALRRKSLTEEWDGRVEETRETVAPVVNRGASKPKKRRGFGFFGKKT